MTKLTQNRKNILCYIAEAKFDTLEKELHTVQSREEYDYVISLYIKWLEQLKKKNNELKEKE